MSISQQSGLQARAVCASGLWALAPATGRSGGAGAGYDTDVNSVGGDACGPHNANYSVDAGDLNANVMARPTTQGIAPMRSSDNGVVCKRINDDRLAALQASLPGGGYRPAIEHATSPYFAALASIARVRPSAAEANFPLSVA
jgi:hypothetical protein